jgi:hypothetical protein
MELFIMSIISMRYKQLSRRIEEILEKAPETPTRGYNTAVPKINVSKSSTLVMRIPAHANVGLVCSKKSYHLHGLASDVNLKLLEPPS